MSEFEKNTFIENQTAIFKDICLQLFVQLSPLLVYAPTPVGKFRGCKIASRDYLVCCLKYVYWEVRCSGMCLLKLRVSIEDPRTEVVHSPGAWSTRRSHSSSIWWQVRP